jgi:hypothetical protein
VPDSLTRRLAFATSGADQRVPGFFVYGQYGLWPGNPAGRT